MHTQKLASKKQPKSKTKSTTSQDPESLTSQVNEFLDLDTWRYESLPETVVSRLKQGEEALSKDDLIQIMKWKMYVLYTNSWIETMLMINNSTHGHSRPMLIGMIKSNAEKLVSSCVSSAVKGLPSDRTFPQESLDALLPLRGVGPATASLILSILSRGSGEVPFYSDDVYLWVVDGVVPSVSGKTVSGAGVELKVKYNLKEYEVLWGKVWELVGRLNGSGGSVSFLDVEKVAYVLKNIDVSGFELDDEAGEMNERKRKVEDEDVDEDVKEKAGDKKKRTK